MEKNEKRLEEKIAADSLFTTNIKKEGLKEKRQKLKADRFKEIEYNTTSKVDEKLIKRYANKMTNRETKGLEPVPKRAKVANRKKEMVDDDLGDLDDIWATPNEVRSKKFQEYKDGLVRRHEALNVKSVILPAGGQSYNPNIKDHKYLLRNAAKVEEIQVEKKLKDLKKLRPFTYGYTLGAADALNENGEIKKVEYDSEIDSSDEEIDMDAPLGNNKPVDRLNIKNQS